MMISRRIDALDLCGLSSQVPKKDYSINERGDVTPVTIFFAENCPISGEWIFFLKGTNSQDLLKRDIIVLHQNAIPHVFKANALAQWIQQNAICPTCRQPMNSKELLVLLPLVIPKLVRADEAPMHQVTQIGESPSNLIWEEPTSNLIWEEPIGLYVIYPEPRYRWYWYTTADFPSLPRNTNFDF